jgi:DNA primase
LKQPVMRIKAAPPRAKRSAPMGLDRQVMRLIVAHPLLASELNEAAVQAIATSSPDHADMFMQLFNVARSLGPQANFASLAEALRVQSADFEPLISEVASESESELETVRLELAGAVRQTRLKLLKSEVDELVTSGLNNENARQRYRELMLQQETLKREMQSESPQR